MWDCSTYALISRAPHHSVRLARSCLPIREDGRIVSVKCIIEEWYANTFEYVSLSCDLGRKSTAKTFMLQPFAPKGIVKRKYLHSIIKDGRPKKGVVRVSSHTHAGEEEKKKRDGKKKTDLHFFFGFFGSFGLKHGVLDGVNCVDTTKTTSLSIAYLTKRLRCKPSKPVS